MIKMNQEQNNFNSNNFNTQGNNGIPNNQPLNNQGMSFNQQPINPQPQPINNTFESGNANNQSFNNKLPKKMNLMLIIGVVVTVIIAGVTIVILLNKNDNKINNHGDNYNNETNNNNLKNNMKYEGTKIKIVDDDSFDAVNGKIKDVDVNFKYLITNDDILYRIGYKVEKKLELSKPIDYILDNCVAVQTADILVKNEDGSISHVSPYSSKINYTINLENIIYADNRNIITLENGYLYNYTIKDNKTTNKSKVTLYKERKDDKKEAYDSNSKVTLEYLSGGSSIFLKINDEIRQFENFLLSTYGWSSSSRGDSILLPYSGEREYLENHKKLRILYYSTISEEIFTTEDKNTSIYYYDTSSFKTIGDEVQCYKEKGSKALCNESIKKEVSLPNNYTIDNIKETKITSFSVSDAYNPLIIMDDMKVFYYKNGWTELEELSNLYKNNHIVKLITNGGYVSTITVLCDDGYLYEYDTY